MAEIDIDILFLTPSQPRVAENLMGLWGQENEPGEGKKTKKTDIVGVMEK